MAHTGGGGEVTASRNDGTFFQSTDVTVEDSFVPLGPPLLPWENRMGRGHTYKHIYGWNQAGREKAKK